MIYHLAAGIGEKSYPDAFMNSVVTTRNLLDASAAARAAAAICAGQFVHCVLKPARSPMGGFWTNRAPSRNIPSSAAKPIASRRSSKSKSSLSTARITGFRMSLVRPGSVYGAGNAEITGRVGIDTFGLFLHLGGSNTIPFTYVDNCAEAIVLAGLVKGVDGEAFNVVDDDLPSSRQFLRLYKKNVKTLQISLCAPRCQLCVLLSVGEVFAMVGGAIAARIQPAAMAHRLEEDALQQQEIKSQTGLDAKGPHRGGIAPVSSRHARGDGRHA